MKKQAYLLLIAFALAGCVQNTHDSTHEITLPTVTWTVQPSQTLHPEKTPTPAPTIVSTSEQLSPIDTDCSNQNNQTPHDLYYEDGQIARIGSGRLYGLDWSADGSKIAVGAETGIHIFDAVSFEKIIYINTGYAIETLHFSPDGSLIAAEHGTKAALWDIRTGSLLGEIGNNIHFRSCIAV
jgi:WD40 repeat protein